MVRMALTGELETRVMELLWHFRVPVSVRVVHTELLTERDLAYTTVMTVLDRLAKKELVSRVRKGRQWLYSPAMSREDLVAEEVLKLLGAESSVRRAALAEIVHRLSRADRWFLAQVLSREAS